MACMGMRMDARTHTDATQKTDTQHHPEKRTPRKPHMYSRGSTRPKPPVEMRNRRSQPTTRAPPWHPWRVSSASICPRPTSVSQDLIRPITTERAPPIAAVLLFGF